MNQSVPLSSVLLFLGAAVAFCLLYALVKAVLLFTRIMDERTSTLNALLNTVLVSLTDIKPALTSAVVMLEPTAKEFQANMAGVPKLLETVVKIGNAQIDMLEQMRRPLQSQNPFGKPNAAAPRDPEAANMEHELTQMLRANPGMSREEAQMRMNGANEQTVWGGQSGSNFFEGWGVR